MFEDLLFVCATCQSRASLSAVFPRTPICDTLTRHLIFGANVTNAI